MPYKMTHPDSDLTVEADADQVAMYESQGWEKSPHANDPEPADKPKK